ncbi:MAG: cadherin-like domain-containing protein [Gammaproteobacteria bacterium]|nr:cadherin-like domain-containing protein [Gammaproteobacteria bacterium]MDH3464317.1 cadherin-like domain-containing protein [Gammaproteobacteria bacterium]
MKEIITKGPWVIWIGIGYWLSCVVLAASVVGVATSTAEAAPPTPEEREARREAKSCERKARKHGGNFNCAPVAHDDAVETEENSAPVVLNVLSNDTDANSDPLTITNLNGPSAGGGISLVNGATQVEYWPAVGFVGQETFSYTANDGTVDSALPATVTVTVTEMSGGGNSNSAPVANDDSVETEKDSAAVVLTVLSNDTDADSDPLTITNVSTPSAGGGVILVNGATQVEYTPAAGFAGQETFSYTANDGTVDSELPATVTVTVTELGDGGESNSAPVANNDSVETEENSAAVILTVLSNDWDADNDPLTITSLSTPSAGGGVYLVNGATQVEYWPATGFTGQETFSYTANDGTVDSALPATVTVTVTEATAEAPGGTARALWQTSVQPLLASECGSCHVGERFGFAALQGAGPTFTSGETEVNYQRFLDLISLDDPASSRLLGKPLDETKPKGLVHGGGTLFDETSPTYTAIMQWILEEKAERCPDCGLDAPVQYLAYVEQPRIFWALERDPVRSDHGLRDRARIFLQPLQPQTLAPNGPPIDFLGESFCGVDGNCDFGHLAASHDGSKLAFECRMAEPGEDWFPDARWNICIAEIGADGRAINPRVLRPQGRHSGQTMSRSDPFGLYSADGGPLKGVWDHHFQVRRRDDRTPVFGPNDEWVYLSSRGLDPRTGSDGTRTYHGFEHVNNIVAVRADGSGIRSVYRNEGGEADFPFFRSNGILVFHTWNLERMDRHLYTQSTPDGMMELPVFLGRVQGENQWGKAVELAGGAVLGMTGRRFASIDNYVPFLGEHTLGAGLAGNPSPIVVLDPVVHEQIASFPNGMCKEPPNGPNCVIDRYYEDPAYAPDGRAYIAHNPEPTYVLQGEAMYGAYGSGSSYTPARLGIYLIDTQGSLESVLEPTDGTMFRYPTWVGRRQPPRAQPVITDESQDSSILHIADVPLWLTYRRGPDHTGGTSKANHMALLDTIVALRILVKEMDGNACTDDGRPYRFAVNAGYYDHPTHLGINNATGYKRLALPVNLGGDAWGDVPLQADKSVNLRLPAGELLLFQGIDADGHVVAQHARVFAMPPGHQVDTSVKRPQYDAQCASCHGSVDSGSAFVPLTSFESAPFVPMDFTTIASSQAPVDLTASAVEQQRMTFLHRIRPRLDRDCVACHSGPSPAGELSLESSYSATANYPAGKWAATYLADSAYLSFVPPAERVSGYNYSVAWSWLMRQDQNEYKNHPAYADLLAGYSPVGDLAPWDPAYQNLFANDGSVFVYLSGNRHSSFGRSDRTNGNSRDSWLLEILSGRDLSPARDFTGPDHTGYFSEGEIRDLMGVIDVGFPYMARCDDKTIPSGPNSGKPWGDPVSQSYPGG